MRGAFPEKAKIARRTDEAAAEMMHPESVHQHASHEWMLAVGQVPGIDKAATTGCPLGPARE